MAPRCGTSALQSDCRGPRHNATTASRIALAWAILWPARDFGNEKFDPGICLYHRHFSRGDVQMMTRRMAILDSLAVGVILGSFPAFAAPRRSRVMQTLDAD